MTDGLVLEIGSTVLGVQE